MPEVITAQSEPDYDNWGPDTYWSCSDWIAYHQALKANYGKDQADILFSQAWDKQGIFEHDYWACKYDQQFYDYIKQEFPEDSGLLAGLWHAINQAGNAVGNAADAATNVTDVLRTVVPILIIIAAIILVIYAYKKMQTA